MHTPRPLHHNELLVRATINWNQLHPEPWSRFFFASQDARGWRKLTSLFLHSAALNVFSRDGEGVTTDVLPPSESCLFDGDTGAYHVAWGANSKYYNTTRCSLQTTFLALCQSISSFPSPMVLHRGTSLHPHTYTAYTQAEEGQAYMKFNHKPLSDTLGSSWVKKSKSGEKWSFLEDNRQALDSQDCIRLPAAPRCLWVSQSFQTEQRCRPTLGAVQMGSCVEKWAASNHSHLKTPPPTLCFHSTSPCFLFTSLPHVWPLHLLHLSLSPLCPPVPRPPRWLCPGAAEARLLGGRPRRRSGASQACATGKSFRSRFAVLSDTALVEGC